MDTVAALASFLPLQELRYTFTNALEWKRSDRRKAFPPKWTSQADH